MRNLLFLLTILQLTACQSNHHWKTLIDKESFQKEFEILNGQATYNFTNNILSGTTALNTPNTFLATKKKYTDFELKFQVLLTPGLNSGVQIRSNSKADYQSGRVHGYQVEIEDSNRGWAGGIYEEGMRGWLNPLEHNAKGRKAFKKGEWNDYHILVKGDTIKSWVNGVACAHLVDAQTPEGFIGFQVHSIGEAKEAGKTIHWRNVKIKTTEVGKGLEEMDYVPPTIIAPAINNSVAEFILTEDQTIKQLAGTPQVEAPVAAEMDKNGNLWIVELPGFMRNIDGGAEELPDGKIVVLSDLDRDGIFDKRVIFKENLVTPRALCLVHNGILYNDSRALYFDDFETGTTTLVDSFYVAGNNIEHQPNGLYFNINNWIYSAKSNLMYRQVNGNWVKSNTALRGQWGMTADVHGRLIYNDNSNGLIGDQVMPNTLTKNPYLSLRAALFQQLCKDNRVYPYQATAINRGYQNGVLDEAGKLKKFTSACSPLLYKTPGEFFQNTFVCAPEVNAIKRYELKTAEKPFAQEYKQAYQGQEFLISKEETFRPVNIYNHPQGGMLVLDLRKGIIQHRAYMTHYLRELILEKGLEKINGGGVYWVGAKNTFANEKDNSKNWAFWPKDISTEALVEKLGDKNAALRLGAQKELISRDDKDTHKFIASFLENTSDFGKIHAFWTLEGLTFGMQKLRDQLVQMVREKEKNPRLFKQMKSQIVLYHLLTLMNYYPSLISPDLIQAAYEQKNLELDLQLSLTLPATKTYENLLTDLIARYQNNPSFAEAFLAHLPVDYLESQKITGSILAEKLIGLKNNIENKLEIGPAIVTYQYADNRNEGFPAYNKYCASCHGADGRGQQLLAPPILYSEYLSGNPKKLAAVILQGIQGPVHVNGERYEFNAAMPGLKNNPELDDETVAALIAFINNAFSKAGKGMNAAEVAVLRKELEGKTEPLTEAEVMRY